VRKRILFFPSCGGQGYGHLRRCLTLAAAMQHRGWDARLCVTPGKASGIANSGVPLIPLPHLVYPSRPANTPPAYICLTNGNLQALRDGYTSFLRVARSVREAEHVLDSFQPDVIVGDLSLIAWILGQRKQMPVAQLVRSIVHPHAANLFWWRDPPPGNLPPDIRPVFNPLLRWWKLPSISRAENLMRGDRYLIPSIPSLDPLPAGIRRTCYTGPLLEPAQTGETLPGNFPDRKNGPVLYVTLGGGIGLAQAGPILTSLHAAFGGTACQFAVSGGNQFDPAAISAPANFHYFRWLPGQAAITASDAVIYHGGQNTTLELAASGVPGLILPFQSEQESNGRRLEACGAARVLSPIDDPAAVRVAGARWRYGRYQICIVPRYTPQPAALREAVNALLEDPSYRQHAAQLQAEAAGYHGVETAADVLEALSN
jgi:UDP:flavonoid glycosyltransferase YjiC (YdhE family)